jgi:hypothetical protein
MNGTRYIVTLLVALAFVSAVLAQDKTGSNAASNPGSSKAQEGTQIQGPIIRESSKTGTNSSSVEHDSSVPKWKPGDPVKVVTPSQQTPDKKSSATRCRRRVTSSKRCKMGKAPKDPERKE